MRQRSHFNQGDFETHGAKPFSDGACLRLSHEWLLLKEVGRRFEGSLLKAEQIRGDQSTYLISADKVLNSKKLGDQTAATGVTKMTEFALNGWGRGAPYKFDPGVRDFPSFFGLGKRAHGVLGIYGTTGGGERWAHALAVSDGATLFDANNGEWALEDAAEELKVHCAHRVAFLEGDSIFAVHFILRHH